MDKKTVVLMLSEDFARLHKEYLEIEKRVEYLVQDAKNYISSLHDQISSGRTSLLVYTPKKTFPRVSKIVEESKITDSTTLNLSRCTSQMAVESFSDYERDTSIRDLDALMKQAPVDLSVLKSAKIPIVKPGRKFVMATNEIENQCDNANILGTSEDSTSRSRRAASVRATEKIKKLQSVNLKTKLRRQLTDSVMIKSDKVARENEPNQLNNQSPDSDMITELNNQFQDLCTKNVTIDPKKTGKMYEGVNTCEGQDDDTGDMDRTSSCDYFMKHKFSNHESPVDRRDCSEVQWKSCKESKYASRLEKIIEESSLTFYSSKSSVSSKNASKNSKQNSHTIKTVDESNVNEATTTSTIYADVIDTFFPITNSTRDPGDFVMLEKVTKRSASAELLGMKNIVNNTSAVENGTYKGTSFDDKMIVNQSCIAESAMTPPTVLDMKCAWANHYHVHNFRHSLMRSNNCQTPENIRTSNEQPSLLTPCAEGMKSRVEVSEHLTRSHNDKNGINRNVTYRKNCASAAGSASKIPIPIQSHGKNRKSWNTSRTDSLVSSINEREDMNKNTHNVNNLEAMIPVEEYPHILNCHSICDPTVNNCARSLTTLTRSGTPYNNNVAQLNKKLDTKAIDRTTEGETKRARKEAAQQKREALLRAQTEEKRRKRHERELKNKLAKKNMEQLDLEKRLRIEQENEKRVRLVQLNNKNEKIKARQF